MCVHRVRLMLVKTVFVQQPRLARSSWNPSIMQLRKWKRRSVKFSGYLWFTGQFLYHFLSEFAELMCGCRNLMALWLFIVSQPEHYLLCSHVKSVIIGVWQLVTLANEKTSLLDLWEERRILYEQCMDLQLFYRDSEQADAWMTKQEVSSNLCTFL